MGATIRIHRPNLTPEERAYRMEEIKKAVAGFKKEVIGNEKEKNIKENINS
jgi:hypothetical protein